MSITHNLNTYRLAAAVVLGLGLLVAGWSSQFAVAQNASHATVEQREAVFSVPGMDCPMCPATVKRALSRVDGVTKANADLKTKQAHVVFDPAKTDTDTLIAAIEKAGFSAQLKESDHE